MESLSTLDRTHRVPERPLQKSALVVIDTCPETSEGRDNVARRAQSTERRFWETAVPEKTL